MRAMASIRKEAAINVSADALWDALRDVGALHTRLVRGFVTDCRLEGNVRTVTFANGLVARETIVTVDDESRRLAYAADGGRLTHYSSSAQAFPDGPSRCRIVWIADLLPDEMAGPIAMMMDAGLAAMKKTLESATT
jgi:hypothetical protein